MARDGVRALVVDDSKFLRSIVKLVLTKLGITVIAEAENGEEAVSLFSAHRPDLVIMDINMPVLDGFSAFLKMKELCPGVKVIMLTSLYEKQIVEKAVKEGVAAYLVKPVKPEQLANVVKRVLYEEGGGVQ